MKQCWFWMEYMNTAVELLTNRGSANAMTKKKKETQLRLNANIYSTSVIYLFIFALSSIFLTAADNWVRLSSIWYGIMRVNVIKYRILSIEYRANIYHRWIIPISNLITLKTVRKMNFIPTMAYESCILWKTFYFQWKQWIKRKY